MSENVEVVISGISGRFPECDDIETFKEMLFNKSTFITQDNRRWPTGYKFQFGKEIIPCATGKLKTIAKYDATVFAVSPMLANQMETVNRLVLEPSFEAILDAGINPTTLMGANIGCYLATGISENDSIITSNYIEKLGLIGASKAMLSNRVSFALNLTGPSISFYHGVIGGFEALSMAYRELVNGNIEAAIIGSSTCIVDPKLSLQYIRLGYLSYDGLCRAFDAEADGYGRSEGVVIMYLQRAQDAKRSYGTVLLSDSLYFGTNPNTYIGFDSDTIKKSFDEIYSTHKNVKPSDISFLEMDACGVKRLEKLEMEAVAEVFCKTREDPLLVGSVKSCIGNTETSAGFMSILKTLFALDSEYIAPNMNFSKKNPEIESLVGNKLKIVTEKTKLPGPIVAVNSLSITGVLSHVVLKQNPKTPNSVVTKNLNLPRLLILCGRSKPDLQEVIEKIESKPLNEDFVAMTNDIFKTPLLSHFYRGYTILPTSENTKNVVDVVGGENRPIWFVFSGMGSQWNGMGKGLLNIPIFSETVDKCDAVLRPKGLDIRHILTTDDPTIFENIVHAFVGIITVQVGLVNILKAIGIEPHGIIGHSVGENACAYADGCLTLEQAVTASYVRGIASIEVETIKGMMAAIGRGYHQIKDSLPEGIEVACHNSAENCTLTGPVKLVNNFVEKLQNEKIFARAVNVSNIAYHSKHIAPAAPILLKRLQEIINEPKERSTKWISTSVSEDKWDSVLAKWCSAEYLTNNLVSPVLFEEGCKHIPENAIVIEIAPHGLLQAILKRSLHPSCSNVSLTLRSKDSDPINFLLSAIGKLFIAGCQPNVNGLYPKIQYPVPRGTPSIANLATWDHSHTYRSNFLAAETPLSQVPIQIKLNKSCEYNFIKCHQIKGQKIIPPSLYMYLVWQIFSLIRNEKLGSTNIFFEEIKIIKHIYITIEKSRSLTVMLNRGSGNFEVLLENRKNPDNPKVLMTGVIQVLYENSKTDIDEDAVNKEEFTSGKNFYTKLRSIGYELENVFNIIEELSFNNKECYGKIKWNENWVSFLDALMKFYIYSDNSEKELMFPSRIRKLSISMSSFESLKPGDKIILCKDMVTKQLWGKGIEFSGFEYDLSNLRFPRNENTFSEIEQIHFVPHSGPNLQNIPAFLNLCLQLAVECSITTKNLSSKLNVINAANNISSELKQVVSQNLWLKSRISFFDVKEMTAGKFFESNFYFVIVDSFCSMDKLHSQLKNEIVNLFVLVVAPTSEIKVLKNEKSFIEIAKESFDYVAIYFFKNLSKPNSHLPPIMVADNNWTTKLNPILNSPKPEPIILLRHGVESTDLNVILSKQKKYPHIRCLYIMDDNAPKFSSENPFYKNQILQGLPIAILKNRQWGSYRNLVDFSEQKSSKKFDPLNLNLSQYKLKSIDLRFLYFDFEIRKEKNIRVEEYGGYGIEFSGISDSGIRTMGLSYYNSLEPIRQSDEFLTWQIPKHWSLEDASTVPLLYSQAYNLLFLIPLRERKQTILLNSANISFTEAVIAVALYCDYEIYVTVANDNEADLLMNKFSALKRSHLLDRAYCKYEIQLKLLTKGQGTRIVINCIQNVEHLNATLNCLEQFGQYIDHSDRTYNPDLKFGMYCFLKSILFSVSPSNIASMLKLPTEIKQKLHNLVENGIKEGVVKPLTRIITTDEKTVLTNKSSESSSVKTVYKCFSKEEIKNNKIKEKLRYDENHSFIIISGGKKTKLWFELVEWLITRGARKFVVALDTFFVDPKISHQINRLLLQKKATIILTTLKKTDTVEDAGCLIAEANNVAPLEAIFFVALDPAGTVIENLDKASRRNPPFHFICLFSSGLKECERRQNDGLPAILIHAEKSVQKLSNILEQMDKMLARVNNSNLPSLYQIVKNVKTKENISPFVNLSNFLSISLEKLESIGYNAGEIPEFIEVPSLAPKYSQSKGVYPIFVVPSINAEFMNTVTSNLIYPTFCATFTECLSSASQIATNLKKSLENIQARGPVTIVGETWSGCVAIELATMIQETKRPVELMLIEGSPSLWRSYIHQSLGDANTLQFDNRILKEILDINLTEKDDTENLNDDYNWKENLEKNIRKLKCSSTSQRNILKAINGIRNRLVMAVTYNSEEKSLNHITLFQQRPSENSLDQYALSDDIHLFPTEKYEDFIKLREIISVINDGALFKWWP